MANDESIPITTAAAQHLPVAPKVVIVDSSRVRKEPVLSYTIIKLMGEEGNPKFG